jgi:hypothetical protein
MLRHPLLFSQSAKAIDEYHRTQGKDEATALRVELLVLVRLALPLMASQVGMMFMGVV